MPGGAQRNYSEACARAGQTELGTASGRLEEDRFSASFRGGFRVDLGGCPPRPPTDPYVRDYRIRFLRPRFRYATSARPTDSRGG